PVALVIKNDGKGTASSIAVSFAALQCASLEVHDDTVPDTLVKGKSANVTVDVTAETGPCVSVKIIDWFLSYSGRESRGTFDLDIQNPAAAPPYRTHIHRSVSPPA